MALFTTILCAVDFSGHSRLGLQIALDLARRSTARVIVLHTIDLLLAQAAAAAYDERRLKADAENELRALVESLVQGTGAPEIVVEIGRPEQTILATARARQADLIVLGTHGLGGLRKIFFGSVTEKVLRDTEVPVLAVTARESDEPAPRFTGVLAAVEFDAYFESVIRHAVALASELDLPLTILHVVRPLSALPQYTAALGAAQEERIRAAQSRLDEAAATLPARGRTEVLTGAPAETIAARAREPERQIVVLGIGGGRLLHRPGSTAYRVLSLANAAVLTVP
jgi:nucleotide-binding universal stress UspA family protein